MKRVVLAALVATVPIAVAPPDARADSPTPVGYSVTLEVDLPVYAVAGTIAAGWLLRHQLAPPACAPMCDRSSLIDLDRAAAGNWSPTWGTISDVGIATVLAGTGATILGVEGFHDAWSDLVVVFESVLVANAFAAVSDEATRRPRPFEYGDSAPLSERTDGNASLSFFSGHSAAGFAATTALASALHQRDPNGSAWWIALGLGGLASATVATARVLSGNHFPTDVIAGAVVGSSIGALVPALHGRRMSITPTVTTTGATLAVSMRW
ncbi:MAG: phosphatase PAP2 family protein [Polyangiales bacterium]